MSWNFIATRLNGDGTETFIDTELPLTDVSYTEKINAPAEMSGNLSPVYKYLLDDDGDPLLEKDSTAIYVEQDGVIRAGGILTDDSFSGPDWALTITGFAGYPVGQPFVDSWVRTNIDALDVFRKVWDHLQSKDRGNLGVKVDSLKSGQKIGKMVAQGEYDTENGPMRFEYEPVRFSWYETADLGDSISKLSEGTPFDFYESHKWNADKTQVLHRINLGYPRIGSRRHDHRFIVGENVMPVDVDAPDDEYASEILGLGAGEGSAMIHVTMPRSGEKRIRRVKVFEDKSARTNSAMNTAARNELKSCVGVDEVSSVNVFPSHITEMQALRPGDEVQLLADDGWKHIDMWVRISGKTVSTSDGGLVFDVARSDRLA